LPYSGGELSMILLLPKLPDGLPALEKQLSPKVLAEWLANTEQYEVDVSLPKFRFDRTYDLPGPLASLGMVDVFDREKADLSGMTSAEKLYVSAVAHKAFVEVNEEGTEAAAATAVVSSAAFGFPPAFYADQPFLFLIRDAKRGTILFMGRVMNPKE
jgi:serpin B